MANRLCSIGCWWPLGNTVEQRSRAVLAGVLLVSVVGAVLGGCKVTLPTVTPTVSARDLASGVALFGSPVGAAEVPDVVPLEVTPAMREFLKSHGVTPQASKVTRLRKLLRSLIVSGYYEAAYDANLSLTAAETFDRKAGNCLAYTNLFVALAREVGLGVSYQVVEVPPSFDARDGTLVRNRHVNVLVDQGMPGSYGRQDTTVDFNRTDARDFPARSVTDGFARSLYYGNLSVDAWARGERRQAFAYNLKALLINPRNPDFWSNLGSFYSRAERHELALTAYAKALEHDDRHRPAIAGSARSFAALGRRDESRRYANRVESARRRNPYYHFALAQAAFEAESFERALALTSKALELKRDDHRFHYLQGLAQSSLGDLGGARKSMAKALRLATHDGVRQRYDEALKALESNEQGDG